MARLRDEDETLRLARERLADWRPGEAEVTDIRLEGEHPDTVLILMFTHIDRPGCEFGFRWSLKVAARDEDDGSIDPEIAVSIFEANIDENIEAIGYGLPQDCSPGEVTWL